MSINSLGDQVSKKMSTLILIFVVTILFSAICVSLIQSLQIFNKQVNSWITVIPEQAITSLIDSDDFAIKKEVEFIKSTGLFSSFGIMDNQKRVIDSFGAEQTHTKLTPIQDEAKVTWGYYFIKVNFSMFILPFIYSGIIFLGLILGLYFLLRKKISSNLKFEFSQFNQFLNEIELLTKKIHEIYDENIELRRPHANSSEQVIINRAISRLIEEIRKANQSLREAVSNNAQKRFEDELTQTALQVAHDIGSPLAVLETIVEDSTLALPEEKRIAVRHAGARMRDIINSLLKKAKRDLLSLNQESIIQQSLYSLINQIVSEKRVQYHDINIDFIFNKFSYGLFAMVKVTEFSRILSNLINNAVEAIESKIGSISISLSGVDENIVIQIKDNGKGISSDLITKLGHLGITHGKTGGMGLGLYHAKTSVENWGGKLELYSQIGEGTEVKLYLPQAKPPIWFVHGITLSEAQTIVIIDDDESIHLVWKERLSRIEVYEPSSLKVIHLFSPEELIAWHADMQTFDNVLFLCDYEFRGMNETGIDLITKLQINYVSILVTSRFYSDDIILKCEASGIKLLPKDAVSIVPIIQLN